jgi:hypothetical protein
MAKLTGYHAAAGRLPRTRGPRLTCRARSRQPSGCDLEAADSQFAHAPAAGAVSTEHSGCCAGWNSRRVLNSAARCSGRCSELYREELAIRAVQPSWIDAGLRFLFALQRISSKEHAGDGANTAIRPMNWFRLRIGACARLALFALAVQLVVSFGHMHRDDLGLPPLAAADQTRATSAIPAPIGPSDQHQRPAPDDYCPICASMALIASGLPALPPVLVAPQPIRTVWPSDAPVQKLPPQFAASFQARAPPLA